MLSFKTEYVQESLLEIGFVEKNIIVSENDLYPFKLCKGHKCLTMCNFGEDTEKFNLLLDLHFRTHTRSAKN